MASRYDSSVYRRGGKAKIKRGGIFDDDVMSPAQEQGFYGDGDRQVCISPCMQTSHKCYACCTSGNDEMYLAVDEASAGVWTI